MTPRNTKRQRLESAGYRHVSGWVPVEYVNAIVFLVNQNRAEVERIAETSKPSGRPRKQPA